MNRIYQGRVSKVEIPDGKDEQGKPKWKKLDAGESALWQHHELFQDAVNYYTLALAAMAAGLKPQDVKARKNEINQWRHSLAELEKELEKAKKAKDAAAKEAAEKKVGEAETTIERLEREEAVWEWREQVRKAFEEDIERKGQTFRWDRTTLARAIKEKLNPSFDPATASFDDYCDTILGKASIEHAKIQGDALLAILEDAKGRDLNQVGRGQLRALCSTKTRSGDAVTEAAQKEKRIAAAHLIDSATSATLDQVAAKIDCTVFCKTPPNRDEDYRGDEALAKACDRFRTLHEDDDDDPAPFPELAEHQATFEQAMKTKAGQDGDGFRFPKVFKPSWMFSPVTVFTLWPNDATWAIARKATASLIGKSAPDVERDPIAEARFGKKPVFDYFANLALCKSKPKNDSAWFEFDLAAFVQAINSPHRYCEDTKKRNDQCDRLRKQLRDMLAGGEDKNREEDDTSERLRGFGGDYRIGMDTTERGKLGVFQLIHDERLLAETEVDESDGDDDLSEPLKCPKCGGACRGYGINENTLRGWSELRQKWREATNKSEFQGEANRDDLVKELDRIRRDQQGDRPEESGSGGLFKHLQLPEYHCIWKDSPPNENVHWVDPLWAWVKYRELQIELEKTERPIRFTPAHPTESPRHFIFPKQANRSKPKSAPARGKAVVGEKTDHLPGMFVLDDEGKFVPVNGDEAWLKDRPRYMAVYAGLIYENKPTKVRIIFSAPRLRRDGIRSDKENSLGSIPLLQPMLEALGIESKELPEINFANCPVTLLGERRERPNERAKDEPDAEQAKPDRYDLNLAFPITLKEESLQNHSLFQHKKPERWNYQKSGDKGYCFAQFNYSAEEPRHEISLQWPSDIEHSKEAAKGNSKRSERKHKADWFDRMNGFSCLSIDLGQREGGAYALMDVLANGNFGSNKKGKPVPSRLIGRTGKDGVKEWRAALALSGMLKLPGEDAKMFVRPPTPPSKNGVTADRPKGVFQEEPWGDSGRPPLRKNDPGALCDETENARRLLSSAGFDQLDILQAGWEDWNSPMFLSFPEQNDKLIIAARRYLSRVRRLHRWCAFLTAANWPGKTDTAKQKHERAMKEIREACGLNENGESKNDDKTKKPLEGEAWIAPAVKKFVTKDADNTGLFDALKTVLEPMVARLPSQFEELANRCAPLRGRSWRWTEHQRSNPANRLHILLPTGDAKPNVLMKMPDGTEQKVTWIRGQRGLSTKRIGQLEDLRRLFQSLNQIVRREIGTLPRRRKRGEKGDELPDCCPKLLDKLDQMKEQRVNQLSHKVLALALGLRLKKSGPTKSEAERKHRNIHGEYERIEDARQPDGFRRPVDFIVIEDLEHYETTKMRSRKENVRLMRWCRRHFRDKLKQLCEVFGLPVVEVNPADTSKFCSRSGVPGFRGIEVRPGFEQNHPWRKALEKLDQHRKRTRSPLDPPELAMCLGVEKLNQQVAEAQTIPTKSGKPLPCPRTLLAPIGSGNVFIPVTDTATNSELSPASVQADINAAINLALRAIADPNVWSIHPRLRTQRDKKDDSLTTREKRKFGEKNPPKLSVTLPESPIKDSSANPHFFADFAGLGDLAGELDLSWLTKEWTSATLPDAKAVFVPLLHSKSFWGTVKAAQWKRVEQINVDRLKAWRDKIDHM